MRKIVINGRFLLHRITGVERYARETIAELDKIINPNEIEIAIPPETQEIPVYNNIKIVRVGKLHNRLWEHISFPLYVMKKHAISLNLCNVAPLLSPGIVCIHDVKFKARPQDFSKKFLIWYNLLILNTCKRAKRIITVSEFSKKEIYKYYHVDSNKIIVIPNAWQHYGRISFDDLALDKFGLNKNEYYFSMSSLEPNKNFKWIADAAKLNQNQVFAVAGSINETVFAKGIGFDCPNNMKLLGYISDEEAKTLMRDCEAFIFPTYYEGFGIPPLEAVAAGAKCIVASNTDVMHEVLGDSVCFINPNHPGNYGNWLCNVDKESVLGKYSWKQSATKLKKLVKEIAGEKG